MRAAKKLVAVAGLVLLPALLVSAPAHATVSAGKGQEVCEALDSGKIDVSGDKASITITAPEGKLISGYCVKAGSDRSGAGVEYVKVDPPAASVTIAHSSCKDVSHYSVSYVTDGKGTPPTTEPTEKPTETTPTEKPTTEPTEKPTETTPTTEPTETTPTETTPTTEPTETSPTSPETTATPTQAVSSATATVPGGDSDDSDDDQGVAGDDETAPTAVDAGLTGSTTPGSTTWIATVSGLAGAVLLAASAYLMRMRKRGDHRA